MKPGWQTTEFWITLLTQVAGIVNLFHPLNVDNAGITQIAGIAAMIATGVAYIISRTKVKAAAPTTTIPTQPR